MCSPSLTHPAFYSFSQIFDVIELLENLYLLPATRSANAKRAWQWSERNRHWSRQNYNNAVLKGGRIEKAYAIGKKKIQIRRFHCDPHLL